LRRSFFSCFSFINQDTPSCHSSHDGETRKNVTFEWEGQVGSGYGQVCGKEWHDPNQKHYGMEVLPASSKTINTNIIIYIYTHTHTHIYIRTMMSVWAWWTRARTRIYVYIYIYTYTYIYILYVCIYMCIRMYIYIYMYICVYIQIYSYADTSWDDDRNSCKSTCSSCIMQFHMHSLMTDYCDVNFSSRSYRYLWLRARSSVQMDISCRSWFFGNMRLVVFEMYRSCSAWALFRRVITDSLFSPSLYVYLESRWDYQPSSSSYLTASDWYRWHRTMALPWPFFSVLRCLNQHRPWPGVSLTISFNLQVYSTRSDGEYRRVCC
jgi:hypothetical protein